MNEQINNQQTEAERIAKAIAEYEARVPRIPEVIGVL